MSMEFFVDFVFGSKTQRDKIGVIRYLDLFAFTPIPRYFRRRSTSFRSVAASFIFFCILLGYTIYIMQKLVDNAPQTSTTQTRDENGFGNASAPEIVVGFQIYIDQNGCDTCFENRTVTSKPFYDPRFFTFQFWSMYVDNKGTYNSEALPWKVVDNVSWVGTAGQRMATMEDSTRAKIGGVYTNYRNFAALQVYVALCDVTLLPPGQVCATLEQTRTLLRNGEFVLGSRQVGESDHVVYVESYAATDNTQSWYDIEYATNDVVTMPDFFSRFTRKTETFLKRMMNVFFLTVSWRDDEPLEGRSVLTWRFLLSKDKIVETRSPDNLLSAIGAIAALYTGIFGPMMFVFGWYNRRKFYKRHPKWDTFGDDFKAKGQQWLMSTADDGEQEENDDEEDVAANNENNGNRNNNNGENANDDDADDSGSDVPPPLPPTIAPCNSNNTSIEMRTVAGNNNSAGSRQQQMINKVFGKNENRQNGHVQFTPHHRAGHDEVEELLEGLLDESNKNGGGSGGVGDNNASKNFVTIDVLQLRRLIRKEIESVLDEREAKKLHERL